MQQNSTSVLVIRLDGIGDALALTPLLAALRDCGVPVDLVMRQENAAIFTQAAARAVRIAPFELRSSTKTNLAAIARFGSELADCGYNVVLVATEDPGGYRLAKAVGSPHRIGFANGFAKPMKTLWVRSMLTTTLYRPAGFDRRDRHECEVLFQLGESLLGNRIPSRDPATLRPFVLASQPELQPYVAVQITQKWLHFGATIAQVSKLLQRLQRERPVRAIASSRERALADEVEGMSRIAVERFEDLAPWKEAIGAARALIAPDSGATHVAGMIGTPTVALFAARGDFERQVARWHPWAAPYHVVRIDGEWAQRIVNGVEALLA
jgi:ADP-heptose:LPS heptosyltransferase